MEKQVQFSGTGNWNAILIGAFALCMISALWLMASMQAAPDRSIDDRSADQAKIRKLETEINRMKAIPVMSMDGVTSLATSNHHALVNLGGLSGRVDDIGTDVSVCHKRVDDIVKLLKLQPKLPKRERPDR